MDLITITIVALKILFALGATALFTYCLYHLDTDPDQKGDPK